jgi:hypothetical protein
LNGDAKLDIYLPPRDALIWVRTRLGLTMTRTIRTIHVMSINVNESRRRAVAAAAGAVLFILGLREAVRLRDADLELARSRARQLGATRILAGVVLLVRPQLLTTALGLSGTGKAGWWLSRMLAVRELAVGTGTAAASRPAADPWPWLMTVSAIDGAEALVLIAALRRKAVDQAAGPSWPQMLAAQRLSSLASPILVDCEVARALDLLAVAVKSPA